MLKIVGQDRLMLTNFPYDLDWKGVRTTAKSINDLEIPLNRICLLDSESSEELKPEDANLFDYFLFGGILGNGTYTDYITYKYFEYLFYVHVVDEFDFDRTSVLRVKGFPTRNLGSMQMTTDTAVRVSKMILIDSQNFSQIPFIDRPEFEIDPENNSEKLLMNFRYVADETSGEALICPEVLALLKEDFDFNISTLE